MELLASRDELRVLVALQPGSAQDLASMDAQSNLPYLIDFMDDNLTLQL